MLNGFNLKELRSVKGVTQKELIGDYLSRSSLARFEQGGDSITLQASYEISAKLGLTLEEFKYEIVDTDELITYRKLITRYYYFSQVKEISPKEEEEVQAIYSYFKDQRYKGIIHFQDYMRVRTHLLPLLEETVTFLELPEEDIDFLLSYFKFVRKFFVLDFKILSDVCRQFDYNFLKSSFYKMVPIDLDHYAVYGADARIAVHQFLNNFFDRALAEGDLDVARASLDEHSRFLAYFSNGHYEELHLLNQATYDLLTDQNAENTKRMYDLIAAFKVLGKLDLSSAASEVLTTILETKTHGIPQNFVGDN